MNAPAPIPYLAEPNLDPALRARVEFASDAVHPVLESTQQIRHDDSTVQLLALSLFGSVIELFSGAVMLARFNEPTGIPVLLRSMYEAHVELDNLLRDAGYVDYLTAANLKQALKIMASGPLRDHFQVGRKTDFDQLTAELEALKDRDIEPLHISQRCERVGRRGEYDSLYALFCLDAHNNVASLAERHIGEDADGAAEVRLFGPYGPTGVIGRLNLGMHFLVQASVWMHRAYGVPAPQVEALAAQLDAERRLQGEG